MSSKVKDCGFFCCRWYICIVWGSLEELWEALGISVIMQLKWYYSYIDWNIIDISSNAVLRLLWLAVIYYALGYFKILHFICSKSCEFEVSTNYASELTRTCGLNGSRVCWVKIRNSIDQIIKLLLTNCQLFSLIWMNYETWVQKREVIKYQMNY